MAVPAGTNTLLARSSDGLTFTAGERLTFGGVPELAALSDGRVRLYVRAQGIVSYVSADRETTWVREGTALNPGGLVCDPFPPVGFLIHRAVSVVRKGHGYLPSVLTIAVIALVALPQPA